MRKRDLDMATAFNVKLKFASKWLSIKTLSVLSIIILNTYFCTAQINNSINYNLSAKAQQNANVLSWRTYSENNVSGFEILRSKNGIQFEKIGFEKSLAIKSNNNATLDYSYNDNSYSEDVYYRINQIAINGESVGTSTIVVKTGFTVENQIYPNPVTDNLNIVLASNKTEIVIINLMDQAGKIVLSKQETIENSKNYIHLNTYKIQSGWYLLNIKNIAGEQILSRKIIKL